LSSANFTELLGIGRVSPVHTMLPRRRRPKLVSGQVVARREDFHAHAVVPEVIADGHEVEGIPEVRAAFGQHVRIRRDALAAAGHQRRGDVQRDAAAQASSQ
jgi:hypothetical protein